jgi:hypothetical protein
MTKWTKKDLSILKREGFKKFEDGGYIKKVGKIDYMVYKQECTVDWAKYFRAISDNDTDYYDEDEIACLDDLLDRIKGDMEINKIIEAQKKPECIDLSGKIMVIDGIDYKLEKVLHV